MELRELDALQWQLVYFGKEVPPKRLLFNNQCSRHFLHRGFSADLA
jgi:hypothetical protein